MRILIRTLTGKTFGFDVLSSTTAAHLKGMIYYKEGVPPHEQRLIFAGLQLQDDATLDFYNVKQDDSIHLVLRLRGMISTFDANDFSDPLIQYLMLSDIERKASRVPLAHLRAKAKQERTFSFHTFSYIEDPQILDKPKRELLCSFLDFMWLATTPHSPIDRVDMRVVVPGEQLCNIISAIDNEREECRNGYLFSPIWRALRTLFLSVSEARGEPKIALRMTRGPTNACINFHTDGPYASSTSQIALNDSTEYKCGRLCFFVNDTVHELERPAGSLTQHQPKALHGVTSLTEGTRKSLFIVDGLNGLGENGVTTVSQSDVEEFLYQRSKDARLSGKDARLSDCVICQENTSSHVVIPCGHLCLCATCETNVIDSCPLCRSVIQGKHKVYF